MQSLTGWTLVGAISGGALLWLLIAAVATAALMHTLARHEAVSRHWWREHRSKTLMAYVLMLSFTGCTLVTGAIVLSAVISMIIWWVQAVGWPLAIWTAIRGVRKGWLAADENEEELWPCCALRQG